MEKTRGLLLIFWSQFFYNNIRKSFNPPFAMMGSVSICQKMQKRMGACLMYQISI